MRDRENRNPAHRIKPHKKLAILKLVGSYGQLGEVELAHAVWPESVPAIAAKRAELSTVQLEAEGYLLRIKDASGSFSLILCPRGEASLRLEGIECRHGVRFQLGGRQFDRRRMATQYLVHRQVQGRSAHHESSLLIGKSRVRRSELTKRLGLAPDGLVLMPRSGHGPMRTYSMDWIRVVPTRIPTRELERVLSVASHLGSWVDAFQMVQLDRIILVVDMECDWIISALRQYLSTHLRPDGTPLNIELTRWQIDTSLMSGGYQEIDAYCLLEGASNTKTR
jgi:hypothetical protein